MVKALKKLFKVLRILTEIFLQIFEWVIYTEILSYDEQNQRITFHVR